MWRGCVGEHRDVVWLWQRHAACWELAGAKPVGCWLVYLYCTCVLQLAVLLLFLLLVVSVGGCNNRFVGDSELEWFTLSACSVSYPHGMLDDVPWPQGSLANVLFL